MRQSLIIVVTGLVAGTAGALVTARLTEHAPGTAPLASPAPIPHGAIVPPGWNATLETRLGRVERALADSHEAPTTEAAPRPSEPTTNREQERVEQYQKELALREELLASHEREPRDAAQAIELERTLQAALQPSALQAKGEVREVDCRAKTCLVAVDFASPLSALQYIQGDPLPVVPQCSGTISIPQPPSGDGPYRLSIVYSCAGPATAVASKP
jgi:hypothetical protein